MNRPAISYSLHQSVGDHTWFAVATIHLDVEGEESFLTCRVRSAHLESAEDALVAVRHKARRLLASALEALDTAPTL